MHIEDNRERYIIDNGKVSVKNNGKPDKRKYSNWDRAGQVPNLILTLLFLALFLITAVGGRVYAGRILISIPEEVTVSGPEIRLGALASITGLDGGVSARLRAVNLGQTNLPGYSKGLSRQYISRVIERAGFSEAEYELRMPPRVEVRTADRILKGEVLLAFARNYLERKLDHLSGKLSITPLSLPEDVVLPDREYQLEISPSSGGGNLLGSTYLMFQVSVDNQEYRRIYLGFIVELQDEVYVAAHRIGRGEKLSQSEFSLELKTVNNLQGKPLKDFNQTLLTDGLTRIPIPEGAVLTDYYLTAPVRQARPAVQNKTRPVELVRYGDELEAEVMVGSVTVSTTVKARQNGARGEYITVENAGSGRRFKAQIISANLVRVKQ